MKLIDIVNGPWAVTPEMLLEIQGIYATHLRGDKINIPDVEARLGRKLDSRHETFEVLDGVAVIPVDGVIGKRMNLFTQISGGASTELVQRDVETALADPAVKGIVLRVDSPGGTVDGTAELAEYIHGHRGRKPIVAYSDGMIASAAYWIASAADSVWISGDTNPVGSIGVVAVHQDYSRREEMLGVKTTEITAGKYKRIASETEPLSESGRAAIQERVNYIYAAFVDAVARHRGATAEEVLERMADGRIFIGKQSVMAGLVDGVSTLDALIDILASGKDPKTNRKQQAAAGVVSAETHRKESIMDKEQLQTEYPDLYQAVLEEGKAQAAAAAEAQAKDAAETATRAVAEAEKTTRENICALATAAFGEEPGRKFAAAVERGLTADDVQALGITFAATAPSADFESRQDILSGLKAAAVAPLKPADGAAKSMSRSEFNALPVSEQRTFVKAGGRIGD